MAKAKRTTVNASDATLYNKVYLPYMIDPTYLQIFFGGSSSGKSYFLAQRTVLDVAEGGHNYLITRKVARTIRGSVFNEIRKAISFFELSPLFKINETDMIITCANGYQILFVGLDDVEKVKSITPAKGVITDIWCEEATEDEYDDIKQLEKRLRGASSVKKRIILSFNPILQTHWIYSEYFAGWADDSKVYRDADKLIVHTTYKDNTFLTDDDVYRLENEKDPYYRDVYTYGKWGQLGGAIFKNWTTRDLTEERKHMDTFYCGLDFGYAEDPAACVLVAYDKKRQTVYVLDEVYETGLTNKRLASRVRKVCGRDYVRCDSAEPKSIAELREYGVNAIGAIKSKDSVNFGIQWLQQQKIVIDVKCTNARNEFLAYRWRENKDGDMMPKPEDKNNHIIDAVRYALSQEMGRPYKREAKRDYVPDAYEDKEEGVSWMTV